MSQAVEVGRGVRPPAHPFQIEGTEWLRGREYAGLLADDMGLGKTRQALEAAEAPILVTAPSSLHGTWQDEVDLWRPDLKEGVDWVFAPYTMLAKRGPDSAGRMSKVLTIPRPEYKQPWRTRIADEAHYLKGRDTSWVKAYEKIQSDKLFLLTGTAVPNWAHEIYMLVKFLRPPGVDINSFWRWAEEWFMIWSPKWMSGGNEIAGLKGCTATCKLREADNPCRHWIMFIQGNGLDTHMLRRTQDDVALELPPLTHQEIICPMTPKQRQTYDEAKRDYITWVEGLGEVMLMSDGAQHAMMSQLSTGVDTINPDVRESGKLDMVETLMDGRRHSPTVIGCAYRNTVDAVVRRLTKAKHKCEMIRGDVPQVEMDRIRRQFQAGDLPVLVGTIDKLAEGITLTAADTIIQVEQSWRPVRNQQFAKRIHRLGQDKPCFVISLTTPRSIDQPQGKVLAKKTDQQVRTMSAQAFARVLLEADEEGT